MDAAVEVYPPVEVEAAVGSETRVAGVACYEESNDRKINILIKFLSSPSASIGPSLNTKLIKITKIWR